MTETPIQRAVREKDERVSERTTAIFDAILTVLWLAFGVALGCALAGCTASPVYPVTPPAPVDPVRPAPVDPAPVVDEIKDPVPHATAVQAAAGMTLDELTTLLGRAPHAQAQRDDGTVGALWATFDSTGRKAWLNVILVSGKAEKPVLIPRGSK